MAIWHDTPSLEEINASAVDTLVENLGIRFTEIGEDYLAAEMPVDKRTRQPLGYLHGGASVALAESLGSYASSLCIDTQHKILFGQEINANHVRPVFEGSVKGVTRPYHLGRSSHIWDIRITADNDVLVCVSRLTVFIRDKGQRPESPGA